LQKHLAASVEEAFGFSWRKFVDSEKYQCILTLGWI